ncbi:MAG: rhodanese-like domain-containing protein [Myxococcota bacterium]
MWWLVVACAQGPVDLQGSTANGVRTVDSRALEQTIARAPVRLVDVRTPREFASGHVAGAVNLPVDTLAGHLDELPKDEEVWVVCESGARSLGASRLLAQRGYHPVDVSDGMRGWRAHGFPTE